MTKVTVKPNTNYTFSVWLKGTGGHKIIAYNAWTNPTNTGYDINLTSDWKLYTFTVTSKDVIQANPVQFFIRSNNGTEINLKKPKVEQGSTATPYMPSDSEVTTSDWPKYVGFSNTVKTNKSASDYTWFPVKDSELTNKVDSHVNNKANPHAVTASQVGAYTKTEADAKFATGQTLTDLSNKVIANKGNLASGTDLNNVTDTGFYRIGGLVGGTDVLNVPSELSGLNFYAFLTVTGSLQELTVYSPKQDATWTYSRSVSGSTPIWSSWSKTVMADDSGKVTVKTLQVETIKSNSDTDLLNLSLTGVASATFSYIRINGIVYITAAGNWGNFPDNKQRIVGNIPAGFRPPTDWGTGMNPQGGSRLLSAVIKANGDLGITSDAAQNNVYGQFSMSYPII